MPPRSDSWSHHHCHNDDSGCFPTNDTVRGVRRRRRTQYDTESSEAPTPIASTVNSRCFLLEDDELSFSSASSSSSSSSTTYSTPIKTPNQQHSATTTTERHIIIHSHSTTTIHNTTTENTTTSQQHTGAQRIPVRQLLPILVGLDMLAVALVVPLLTQYYASAGIVSTTHRELLSLLYHVAQMVVVVVLGGSGMGSGSASGVIMRTTNRSLRRTILLRTSFVGSAVSYALLAVATAAPAALPGGGGDSNNSRWRVALVVVSRLLVGCTKHTMTVSAAMMMAAATPNHSRQQQQQQQQNVYRLTAASTVAWIVGPTLGAVLYRSVGPTAPCGVACSLFVVNLGLSTMLNDAEKHGTAIETLTSKPRESTWSMIRSSHPLTSVLMVHVIFTWVSKATNYSQLFNYLETLYGLKPYHRGYLSSYQQVLQLIVHATVADRLLRYCGGARSTLSICTAALAMVVVTEALQSWGLFVAVLCPLNALAFGMAQVSLQTLVAHVAGSGAGTAAYSVWAAMDLLQNLVSVAVPLYRTLLIRLLQRSTVVNKESALDPLAWIVSSALHWGLAALFVSHVLGTSVRFPKCKHI